MPSQAQYRHEDVARAPSGWRTRTISHPSGHEIRVAFPPGARRKGGRLISILHPLKENPKYCNGFSGVRTQLLANPIMIPPAFIDAITSGAGFAAGSSLYEKVAGKKKRGNPGSLVDATRLARDFRGLPPKDVIEAQEAHMKEGAYTVLGEALDLWLNPVEGDPNGWPTPDISFEEDDVLLASEPDGSQFYFVKGDQAVSDDELEGLGLPLDTDLVPLGLVYGINYATAKSFDGGTRSEYAHRFGEETGEVPALYYDRKKKKMYLVGGAYSIAPVRGDLNASPGIVN